MSSANERIFRAAAIERISSPEQLDQLVRIARPFDWAAVFAIGLALTAVVVWNLVGRVATQTPGDGILIIRGGQVVDAVSAAAGRLDSMSVAVNDRVSQEVTRKKFPRGSRRSSPALDYGSFTAAISAGSEMPMRWARW
jgi:HlyD family secretion protein